MANGDGVRTDDDFLDQQPHDTLPFGDIEGVHILPYPPESPVPT